MKNICLISILILFSVNAYSQSKELLLEEGVESHPGIDAIYKNFSDAYRTLDVEKVAGLYTGNAAYLAPGSALLQGRDQIRPTFRSFFDWIRNEGRTMTISFRIFQRKVERKLAYDVGIYTIEQYKDGKEMSSGQGKFVTVAVRETDGKWRFQVDGYNDIKPDVVK